MSRAFTAAADALRFRHGVAERPPIAAAHRADRPHARNCRLESVVGANAAGFVALRLPAGGNPRSARGRCRQRRQRTGSSSTRPSRASRALSRPSCVPRIASTVAFQMTDILSFAFTCSTKCALPRNALAAMDEVHAPAVVARAPALPATPSRRRRRRSTSSFWYIGPSQSAHCDTPRPSNSASPGTPSLFRRAPDATIDVARACTFPQSVTDFVIASRRVAAP